MINLEILRLSAKTFVCIKRQKFIKKAVTLWVNLLEAIYFIVFLAKVQINSMAIITLIKTTFFQ